MTFVAVDRQSSPYHVVILTDAKSEEEAWDLLACWWSDYTEGPITAEEVKSGVMGTDFHIVEANSYPGRA